MRKVERRRDNSDVWSSRCGSLACPRRIARDNDYVYKDITNNANFLYRLSKENLKLVEDVLGYQLDDDKKQVIEECAKIKLSAFNINNKRFCEILDCYLKGNEWKTDGNYKYDLWRLRFNENVIEIIQERQKMQTDELSKKTVMVRCMVANIDKVDNIEKMKLYAECLADEQIFKTEKERCNALENKYLNDLRDLRI